jgi:hypothetical protein
MVVKEVLWENVREEIVHINPTLTQLIDNVSPGKTLPFVEIHYRYGDLIIDKGKIMPPSELTADIEKSQAFKKLCRDKLSYSPIPLGLLLNKSSEVFIERDKQSIPLKILQPGSFFGLFEWFDQFAKMTPFPVWSVASGARTVFLLPKISNIASHQRIRKELGVRICAPTHFSEHWQLFKEIAHAQPKAWGSKVLFFSREWFDESRLKKDINWAQLYFYLSKQAWFHARYGRNDIVLSLLWDDYIEAISKKRFRPRPYAMHLIQHIISICGGGYPGFIPLSGDNRLFPHQLIEQVYLDIYKLSQVYPTIMCAGHRITPDDVVYFSLSLPTIMTGFNDIRQYNIIEEQRNMKYLLDIFQENFTSHSLEFNTKLLTDVKFSYFHTNEDAFSGIQSSNVIPDLDNRFVDHDTTQKRNFCCTSLFWRGCIKVGNKFPV